MKHVFEIMFRWCLTYDAVYMYHRTTFEKNEIEKFGILTFDVLFIRDLRIIPEGENMSIQ